MSETVSASTVSALVNNYVHHELYREITRRLGFPPTRHMLSCIPGAESLSMTFQAVPEAWKPFRLAVHNRWSEIVPWTSATAGDGRVLDSAVERVVYEELRRLQPDSVEIEVHPSCFERCKADFALAQGVRKTLIEVIGVLERDRPPCNAYAEEYERKLRKKMAGYAARGIAPVLIYLTDVCNPALLACLLTQAFDQVRGVL